MADIETIFRMVRLNRLFDGVFLAMILDGFLDLFLGALFRWPLFRLVHNSELVPDDLIAKIAA